MKLKIFNKNSGPAILSENPIIRVTKRGIIHLNLAAKMALKLKNGDKVSFAQDEDEPLDWYIITRTADGIKIRFAGGKTTSAACNAASFTNALFKSVFENSRAVKNPKAVSFQIATNPIEKDTYAILTKKPINIKQDDPA